MIQNIFDPRVATWVCNTDTPEPEMEFDFLCNKFGIKYTTNDCDDMGRVTKAVAFNHTQLKSLIQLKLKYEAELIRIDSREVFGNLEMPLVALLAQMEIRGVEISNKVLQNISSSIETKIASTIIETHRVVGQPFNLASPEQVSSILFDKLKLPTSGTYIYKCIYTNIYTYLYT
jgi:DNA polymerase I-like protein with 3'-5' exonuclease and polymerase domains